MRRIFTSIALALIAVFMFSAVAVADTAPADTSEGDWWNDFVVNIPNIKLGTVGLDAGTNYKVTDETDGVVWDLCASVPVVEFGAFSGDLGISKAGLAFAAVTFDVVSLNDVPELKVPGSEHITLNVGLFAGRDIDAYEGEIAFESNDWTFGAVVNLGSFGN